MTAATSVLKQVLQEITALGEVPLDNVAERIGEGLEGKLTDADGLSSRYASLGRSDWTGSEFSKELRYQDESKILVMTPDATFSHLAHMIMNGQGTWKIRSFMFLCPACFGTGFVSDMRLCDSCGAKGWGGVDF